MAHRTPRARVTGLGSARGGTHHWWMQRVSSVALVPLAILFVIPFAGALGESHADVLAIYASPWNAVVAVLFIAVTFYHLMQGIQVVVEDYVHHAGAKAALLLANTLLCGFFGLAGVFAVLKIAFAA